MKRFKIAVCLSGQSRTWKSCLTSLRNFYMDIPHDVHFFGHAWDENWWKLPNNHTFREQLELSHLKFELEQNIPFQSLLVERQREPGFILEQPLLWLGMTHSLMMANHLKRAYEIEHDMRFDLVIRARFDLMYHPRIKLTSLIPDGIIPNTRLMCATADFAFEFGHPAINDTIFMGASHIMDQVCEFSRYYENGQLYKILGANNFNPAYSQVGMGVLLYKWITLRNIGFQHCNFNTVPVLRNVIDASWPRDYDKVFQEHVRNKVSIES